ARFAITVHDENGNPSASQQDGRLMQITCSLAPGHQPRMTEGISLRYHGSRLSVCSPRQTNPVAPIGFYTGIFETSIVCFTCSTFIECAGSQERVWPGPPTTVCNPFTGSAWSSLARPNWPPVPNCTPSASAPGLWGMAHQVRT